MTPQTAVEFFNQAFMTALWLSLPLLIVGFVAGVIISVIQILTSIQDPAFGALPRLLAYLAGIFVFLPWMLSKAMTYAADILGHLGRYA